MQDYIVSDKIFSHLDRLEKYLHGKRTEPITVEIHPTNLCNNRCFYCIAERYRGVQSLTKEELLKIVRMLSAMGTKGIIFSGGGEPFVNLHTIHAIRGAVELGMDVGVITNGLGIKKDDIKDLVRCCTWIRVSIDTVNREVYKTIRGVDGLDKVIENIKGLVAEKKRQASSCTIGTQTVVTANNIDELFETAKFLRDLGADYFQIRPLEAKEPYPIEYIARAQAYIVKCKSLQSDKFKIVDTAYKWAEVDPTKEPKKNYKTCHILPFNGAVDATGDIYLCCHLVGNSKFSYGNLLRDRVEEIFVKRSIAMKEVDINQSYCPIACRGSLVNQTIEENYFKERPHKNFL